MYKLVLIAAFMANVFTIVSSTGTCMKCKKNEKYVDCVNGGCDPRNCSQLGKPVPCVKIGEEACIKGCICIDGYLKADNGTCIKKEDCPSCGDDPNAMSGCGVFCQKCSNYKSKCPLACPEFCNINACECRPGYIYDENIGKCVKPQQCTQTCKDNEVFSNCTNGGCDARNCSQLGFPVPCVKLDPAACKKGCVCKPDYLRAANGTCIPKTECPSCGGDANATAGCGAFCRQCVGAVPCPRLCKPNSCDCKPDFVYDPNVMKCVKQSDCTPTCDVNEVFSDCTNGGCDARNCSQLGMPVPCVRPKTCKKGCICAPGYLRDDRGKCIPDKECPSCGGDFNATAGCGVFCKRCSGPYPCPKICKVNACDCKEGYIYDEKTEKCTLPEFCTPQQCKDNEVYSSCINGYCGYRQCSELGGPILCVDPAPGGCVPGCVCADDYLRADNGTCIPKKDCPGVPQCTDNEVYSSCINGYCGYRKCSELGGPELCVDPVPGGCIPGCVCADDYLRADNGTCIPKKDCPTVPQCKDNEVYSSCINGYCGYRQCSELGGPELCVDPPPGGCVPGCVCADGYLRDDNGMCIPKEDCPPVCNINEVYSNCTNSGCLPKNCSQLGKPVPCIRIAEQDCIKGCTCAPGYLRADDGSCIEVDQCPSCNDDPNAEQGCGTFCDRCSNYNTSHVCPIGCILNGCQCRNGYIYDDNTKKCVLPTQCTPTCQKNEEFSACANQVCRLKNCTQYGQPIPFCPKYDTTKCKPGCICKNTFLRNSKGQCIAQNQCPEAQNPPKNTTTGNPGTDNGQTTRTLTSKFPDSIKKAFVACK